MSFFSLSLSLSFSLLASFSPTTFPFSQYFSLDILPLASDHSRAPYTRISCCMSTESALFSTTLTLSSWPRSEVMTSLNSSETSSLAGSKSRRIRSQRAANQEQTSTKSKERAMRCFSPERIPGVSTSVMCLRIPLGALHPAPSKRARNELPKAARPLQASEGLTARVAPGVLRSSREWEMATTRSVEGSGPMLAPGYFLFFFVFFFWKSFARFFFFFRRWKKQKKKRKKKKKLEENK